MADVVRNVEKSESEDESLNWFIPTELLERSLEPAQVEMITEEEFIADQAADLAIDVTKNATRLEESALVSPTAGFFRYFYSGYTYHNFKTFSRLGRQETVRRRSKMGVRPGVCSGEETCQEVQTRERADY